MDELLARGKRLAIIGAVLMWVVSPVLIGGLITVTVRSANSSGGKLGGLAMAGVIVWAAVCLVVLVVAFAFMMGGVFLWWRSHNPGPIATKRRAPRAASSRGQTLHELRSELARDNAPEREKR